MIYRDRSKIQIFQFQERSMYGVINFWQWRDLFSETRLVWSSLFGTSITLHWFNWVSTYTCLLLLLLFYYLSTFFMSIFIIVIVIINIVMAPFSWPYKSTKVWRILLLIRVQVTLNHRRFSFYHDIDVNWVNWRFFQCVTIAWHVDASSVVCTPIDNDKLTNQIAHYFQMW